MNPRSSSGPAARLGAALLGTLVLLAGACSAGSGAEDDGIATLQDSDGITPDPEAAEHQDALQAYAECMREHGVDMPDPGDGNVSFDLGDVDPEVLTAAEDACLHHLERVVRGFEADPAEQARLREQALAFAACLREHGLDVPDPTFGERGVPVFDFDFDAVDEARLEAATRECGDLVEGAPDLP